jgi:UDP-N-acetylglucosamine--N-acetylmuramyl-(pentapeptide) pyrophosphoryl-undecaprenol N-acetylglucosamine transferase
MSIFFTSPIGLGHATRDIAIADKLNSEILFVSGGGAASLLTRKGFKALDVYRPEKFVVASGQLQHSFWWLMRYYSYYKRCKNIAKDILENNNGLIVSDEDFAAIAIGEEMKRRRILITDITETHFISGVASVFEKMMNKRMQKMMGSCDYVIIPDVGEDSDNRVHVGPIVRPASADRDSLRRRFAFERNTIIVCVGGTDAGRHLIEKALEAFHNLKSRTDAELVIVPGPSLELPQSSEYRNLGFVNNLHELISAADLVISLAGRSTIDESFAYGTPGIFIPIKNHFEQEESAARAGYRYEDIFRLEELIEEKLGHRRNPMEAPGAEKAAEIINKII